MGAPHVSEAKPHKGVPAGHTDANYARGRSASRDLRTAQALVANRGVG